MVNNKKGILVSILVFMFLGFLLPLLFMNSLGIFRFSLNIGIGWFVLLYSGLKLSLPMAFNKERILEMTFWLFVYIFMGIVPLVQILSNNYPWAGYYGELLILKSQIIILLGIISYDVGHKIAIRKRRNEVPSIRSITLTSTGFNVFSVLVLAIAIVLLYQSIGFHSLFLPRNAIEGVYNHKSQNLITDQLIKVPIFVCLLIGIMLWKKKKLDSLFSKWMVGLLFIVNLIVSNPISSPRYWVGSVLLTILVAIVPWKKGAYFFWSMSYLFIFLVLFPYADLFRNELDVSIEAHKITDIMINKGDYDAFQMLLNTTLYVQEQGITLGRQLMGAILFWVPRNLWPGKPISSGQLIGEGVGYHYTNLSCPLWAESYVNFGYIGVVVIFLVYGYISNVLQYKYLQNKHGSSVTFYQMFIPFLSAYQFFLLRGDLMNGLAYLSSFILFCYLYTVSKQKVKVSRRKSISMHTANL